MTDQRPSVELRRLSLRSVAAGMFIVGTLVATGLLIRQLAARRAVDRVALDRAVAETVAAARTLDSMLAGIASDTRALAAEVGAGRVDGSRLGTPFDSLLARHADLAGVGLAYAPGAFSGARLYAPYRERGPGGVSRDLRIDQLFDYSEFAQQWFNDPMLDGAMWTEPRVSDERLAMRVAFAAPFTRPGSPANSAPIGIAFASLAPNAIERVLGSLQLGKLGYAMVFSASGRYLSHPRAELVATGRTIFETAWTNRDTALNSMAIRAEKGTAGVIRHFDDISGQSSWIVHQPVRAAGWTLALVIIRDELADDVAARRRSLIAVTLAYLVGALGLGAWIVLGRLARVQRRDPDRQPIVSAAWFAVTTLALLLASGIAVVWAISDRYPPGAGADALAITDRSSLQRFLRQNARDAAAARAPAPIYLRTGIFLKSVEFESSYDVKVTGDVWQLYEAGVHDSLARGFVFPEAVNIQVQESFRRKERGHELVGWTFIATLRQDFEYLQYPFDRQDVWLRVRHPDLHRNVVLVPDLDAYALTNPAARPGIEENLLLPGWTLLGSYFDYRPHRYNANFGLERVNAMDAAPEMSFNVILKRKFLEPFVSKILPLVVVAVLLFAILYVASKRRRGSDVLGFTAMEAISGCAALFFVVTFQHISLHEAIGSPRIVYFEYFYFTTYLALMLVCINAILFATESRLSIVEFEDNLLPKMVFWPAYLGLLFGITLVFFY